MKYLYALLFSCSLITVNAQSVLELIEESNTHEILEMVLTEAQLSGMLDEEGPFTVFAPTDAAFAAMDEAYLNELLADPDGDLRKILRYHIMEEEVTASELDEEMEAESNLGQDLEIEMEGGSLMINNAEIIVTNLEAENGIVHVIDAVLMPPATNVMDIVIESEVHNMMEIAVVSAQLNEPLSIGGPYTIFAPTDAAFETMNLDYLQELLMDPTGDLHQLLRYHIIEGKMMSDDFYNGQIANTDLGQALNIEIENEEIRINDAVVTIQDIETFNGVVHVIDAVMSPPATTVVDVIVNSENHTSLENAVIDAQLAEHLNGEGPFTVFAPTDAAFSAMDPAVLNTFLDDPTGSLQRLLNYHIVENSVTSNTLSDGEDVRTHLGQHVDIAIDDNAFFINDVLVSVKDIETFNGVVHVLDAVLTPPSNNILEIVVNSEEHTLLEDAIYSAMLDDDLTADGYYTLFAPTDAAFAEIDEAVLNDLLADPMGDLQDVLLYHVLDEEVLSTDLQNGQTFTTIANQAIDFTIGDNVLINNDAMLTLTDIQTYNGTVHVIDQLLLPQLTAVNALNLVEAQVLPNPTTDYLLVNLPAEMQNQEVTAQLINLSGATTKSWVINNDATRIDLNETSTGTYILLLNTDDSYARTKVVVNR